MDSVFQIYTQLRSNNSMIAKQNILDVYRKNKELKEYFRLSCDPTIKFHIKKIPEYGNSCDNKSLSWVYEQLKVLSNRAKTGNAAINHLKNIFENINSDNRYLLKNIINKDAKCGVAIKTINKVWPKCITKEPYQRFQKESEKAWDQIKYPAISTCKEDGEFSDVYSIGTKNEHYYITRGSQTIELQGFHNKSFEKLYDIGDFVFLTEVLVLDEETNEFMPREKGNGFLNSNLTKDDFKRIFFKVIGVVQYENFVEGIEETKFVDRLNLAELFCKILDSKYFEPIEYEVVNSREEANIVNEKRRKLGKEGSVLYNTDSIWKSTDSGVPGTMKQKQREPIDMICTDSKPMNTDNMDEDDERRNWIGSLKFESSDGKVSVWCGQLTEETRKTDPNEIVGKICIVKANDVLKDKDGSNFTLFLASVKENNQFVRNDKTEADSFEDICNILKATRFLGKAKKVTKKMSRKKKIDIVETDAMDMEW